MADAIPAWSVISLLGCGVQQRTTMTTASHVLLMKRGNPSVHQQNVARGGYTAGRESGQWLIQNPDGPNLWIDPLVVPVVPPVACNSLILYCASVRSRITAAVHRPSSDDSNSASAECVFFSLVRVGLFGSYFALWAASAMAAACCSCCSISRSRLSSTAALPPVQILSGWVPTQSSAPQSGSACDNQIYQILLAQGCPRNPRPTRN